MLDFIIVDSVVSVDTLMVATMIVFECRQMHTATLERSRIVITLNIKKFPKIADLDSYDYIIFVKAIHFIIIYKCHKH